MTVKEQRMRQAIVFAVTIATLTSGRPLEAGERCGDLGRGSLAESLAHVEALEQELSGARSRSNDGAGAEADMRPSQERLLAAMEDLACRQEASLSGVKGWPDKTKFVQLPLLFATERALTPSSGAPDFFGSEFRPIAVQLGRVRVAIPEVPGSILTIPGSRVATRPTREGRMQLSAMESMSPEQFWSAVSINTRPASGGQTLPIVLFVHGFNVTFSEAAIAAARLTTGMGIPVAPIFYSWPSAGTVTGYWHDEDVVATSTLRFTAFLEQLSAHAAGDIVVVAHSMGNRIVTRSLAELARRGQSLPHVRNVVMAAADVSRTELAEQWPSLRALAGTQWALYAASSDFALRASTYIHSFTRVGESKGSLFIQPGADTIDASITTSVLQSFGHSYVVASPSVAVDIAEWISRGLSPAARGLRARSQNNLTFYQFP